MLSFDLIPEDVADQFRALNTHPSAAASAELQRGKLAEPESPWVEAIERDWADNVLKN